MSKIEGSFFYSETLKFGIDVKKTVFQFFDTFFATSNKCLAPLEKTVSKHSTEHLPVNLVDWDSDFFPALSLGLFFALSAAIFWARRAHNKISVAS